MAYSITIHNVCYDLSMKASLYWMMNGSLIEANSLTSFNAFFWSFSFIYLILTFFNAYALLFSFLVLAWISQGQLKSVAEEYEGVENCGVAFANLFAGVNFGKSVVRVR